MPPLTAPLPPATQALADFAGVLASYEDAFGQTQRSPEHTVRAILAALGLEAQDECAATAALAAARERAAEAVLAPVYVIPAESEARLDITVREAAAARLLAWSITSEDGHERSGAFVPATLPRAPAGAADVAGYARYLFPPPFPFAAGYYRLRVRDDAGERTATIAAVPPACYLPPQLRERGVWGLAVQLYSLRSPRNWGIGDFTDLGRLAETVAAAGGAAVGINPLHQLRFGTGAAPSPYSPSSRVFLNWIYLDIEALPGYDAADLTTGETAALRATEFIDYDAVARTKRRAARAAYERFFESDLRSGASPAAHEFRAYCRAGGAALRRAATFEALAERFSAEGATAASWHEWPVDFRDPASPHVAQFGASNERAVEFCAFLQWQAERQLGAAARAGSALGIGLYRDLAVGAEVAGADSWAAPGVLKRGMAVGAPPDLLNRRGQNWGVAPFDPLALRAAAYEPFIALLRANMRHAGALRIDHVMALTRLYWIPAGVAPAGGAYVTYRLDELLGIIALESVRARCMVIGEDLGTVPGGLRERLSAAHVLSYRLLQFENDEERFFAPREYPALSLTCTGTHDLPSVGAYWTAHDVEVRSALGLVEGDHAARQQRAERAQKRGRLLAALEAEGLSGEEARRFTAAATHREDRAALVDLALWAYRYLARAPALLLMVQIEDILGEIEQVNLPTTTSGHPNWRRRLPLDVGALASDARFVRLARMLEREGRGAARASALGS